MKELTLRLGDAEWDALSDLADARGLSPEDLARAAVHRCVAVEEAKVQAAAMRLALRHAPLLRRLGE